MGHSPGTFGGFGLILGVLTKEANINFQLEMNEAMQAAFGPDVPLPNDPNQVEQNYNFGLLVGLLWGSAPNRVGLWLMGGVERLQERLDLWRVATGRTAVTDFLAELKWRGLLHKPPVTKPFPDHLATPGRVGYCGFDPTSHSLTIGNLIPIMLLRHFQRAGHRPVVLLGGGTGLIGDPSGKDAERQLRTRDDVAKNVASQQKDL